MKVLQFSSVLVLCAIAVQSSLADVNRYITPHLTDVVQLEDKVPLLGSDRYSKINKHLLQHATSDTLEEYIAVAEKWREDLIKRGSRRSERDEAIKVSLDYFVLLRKVLDEVDKKKCTEEAQRILELNDYHTKGLIYSANQDGDKYANTVRQVVLKRANVCQHQYAENVAHGYKNYVSGKIDDIKAKNELYLQFIDNLTAFFKKMDKFVPYVRPEDYLEKDIGEILYHSLIAMAKQAGDERAEELEKRSIDDAEIEPMIRVYINGGAKSIKKLGEIYFIMAAMDKRVAGDGATFAWMESKEFVRALEGFLFKHYLSYNSDYLKTALLDYIKNPKSGSFQSNLD